MTIADWPNMSKNARSKFHKDLHKKAYPHFSEKKTHITAEQLQKILGR